MRQKRTFHIWYYGLPYADAVPYKAKKFALGELHRQLDNASKSGEYPMAIIVSIGENAHDVKIEYPKNNPFFDNFSISVKIKD